MAKFSSFYFFVMLGACGSAMAQTPALNLMPDGSHDLYIGLGAESRPAYQGARETRVVALPVLQMEWSNGVFIAGASAGMHLSHQSQQEYGPMLLLEGQRDPYGTSSTAGSINNGIIQSGQVSSNKLVGMDEINMHLLAGGFYNFAITDGLRLTNKLLYGAGNSHDGLRLISDLRYHLNTFAPHHTVSVSAGLTLVNQAYNQTYFGVTSAESLRSHNHMFTPSAGVKDVHADMHWNWALSASWLLTSSLNFTRLNGSAADSPLVERASSVSISSALAYRF
ncbi:MAG: MipA/OmpV family protein [Pseudomonadota bacterium]